MLFNAISSTFIFVITLVQHVVADIGKNKV